MWPLMPCCQSPPRHDPVERKFALRQIVLDTETTGLEPELGHRVIEIGAVELIDRKLTGKQFHKYMHPDRDIDDGAIEVHGITLEFLADKPKFPQIAQEFLEFVRGAELIIHNAPFDLAFLNQELRRLPSEIDELESICGIVDTLAMARQKHPGQKNNLDALCKRYLIDNSQRELHGAILDAEILAGVYLMMTGGQRGLFGSVSREAESRNQFQEQTRIPSAKLPDLAVIAASSDELQAHNNYLDLLDKESERGAVWRQLTSEDSERRENP